MEDTGRAYMPLELELELEFGHGNGNVTGIASADRGIRIKCVLHEHWNTGTLIYGNTGIREW